MVPGVSHGEAVQGFSNDSAWVEFRAMFKWSQAWRSVDQQLLNSRKGTEMASPIRDMHITAKRGRLVAGCAGSRRI